MTSLQPSDMSDSSSTTWFSTYTKLRFFSRIRRFLNLNNNSKKKQFKPSIHLDEPRDRNSDAKKEKMVENGVRKDDYKENNDNNWMVLQRAVKRLHFGSLQEKEDAVMEICRMAKGDLKRRKLMAELGVIPPLVAMVGEEAVVQQQRVAVQALIELANGSFRNKVIMVEAGILSKLPQKNDSMDEQTKQGFAQLLLSLSSIANNNGFSLTSSRVIPFLVNVLDSNPSIDTINLCLGTLHNLSLILENATSLVTCDTIDTLLRLCSLKEASEKSLSTLGNLVVTFMGKKALEINSRVPENLIEIMTWEDKPKCQELCAYVLMILAHQSFIQRAKMAKAGIVPVLLEVALLGSPLAQKRVLKLLQWFKDERQVRMGPHSGPQDGRMIISSQLSRSPRKVDVDQGKKVMKNIVKQSLYKNMERISSRANGSGGGNALRFKALDESSSSKSLPY